MEEVWKDIEGYEGMYQVSNFGNVKSLTRSIPDKKCGSRVVQGQVMKKKLFPNGYVGVALCKNSKYKQCLVHRLVATAFIDNPNNLEQVNHKDEDITNNQVDNLEWCTPKYNANYGTRNQKCSAKRKRPVNQYDLNGNLVNKWDSAMDAEKYGGYKRGCIGDVCSGRWKTHAGYIWKYA